VRNYWLDLFTGTTWDEFLSAGASVSGFRESKWTTVQKMKPGDYLLCYMIGISRFIGILEVTSEAFKSEERIWKDQLFPCRVKVKSVVTLSPETAVPVHNFRETLTCFTKPTDPRAPDRPYRVIGYIEVETPPSGMFDKPESVRPAVREAVKQGADAIILLDRTTETAGVSTISSLFASARATGNTASASGFGSSMAMANRRGHARAIAIQFLRH
jgi:EVE domain